MSAVTIIKMKRSPQIDTLEMLRPGTKRQAIRAWFSLHRKDPSVREDFMDYIRKFLSDEL